ncbi:MAG: hypothetical protein WB341_07545 [Terracidiphilus sp.]
MGNLRSRFSAPERAQFFAWKKREQEARAGLRRIMDVFPLAKKDGCAAVDQACAAALEMGVSEYRFVRRYLERSPQGPLSLRQVNPPQECRWYRFAFPGQCS